MKVHCSILKFVVTSLALVACVAPLAAPWGELANDSSAQGSFVQVIFDENGTPLSKTTGEFRALRPSYIDWRTDRPERQRYLINDEAFWQQDEELGIVIKRDTLSAANTPLRFIWGDMAAGSDVTVIEMTDTTLGVDAMIGTALQRVIAEWKGQNTLAISSVDALGQRTVVTLTIDTRESLSPRDFSFELPPAFDLYDETSSRGLIGEKLIR